ncbi:MAG: aldehyde ferredoxin oxidoreductase C-terminal domain-containing protein [Chloroflexota bacterium]
MSSNAVFGYAGKVLRVNLSNESLSEEILDEPTLRKWVGGVGFGAKYLYEEVPPEVQWNDSENRLIVACGPLGGTRVGGSGTISISAKGCLTNGATSTQANGFMGAYMKFSGYDAVIFKGIAKHWVYLYLHDGIAELKDAKYLLGKNTWDTENAIKKELGYTEKGMSVFCIGPAGENLVKFAGIFGDKDHAAGHNGIGAVMGTKRLKAFCAARGAQASVKVKAPKQISTWVKGMWDNVQSDPDRRRYFDWGTGGNYETGEQRIIAGTLPIKNYTTNLYPEARLMTNQYAREHWGHKANPCWACRMHHCSMITFNEGPYKGQTMEEPEYEMWAACGPLVGNTDPAEAVAMAHLFTQLGLEGNESGFLFSMVIELYEKGLLKQEDTGGLDLKWGNTAAMRTLLERIARREGAFANMLAEGTKYTADTLGTEAQNCGVYTVKGHSPRGHDHRANWREMFDTATSDIGTYESGGLARDPDIPGIQDRFSPEEVSTNVAKAKGRRQFEDTIGTCTACTRVPLSALMEVFNAVTGWDFTPKEAQDVGFRVANLMRAFNLRHGVSIETERPSPRWSSAPVDGPAKGITVIPHWESMLNNYYKLMGWDRQTGRPYPETLRALGLENVVGDLWK